ncbi:dihydrofolate reductase [Bacillus haimaensis]|uniref:dihydrofolate reductase n=1 Tax=Bacillus haimaensis TaxID=3160967 RepID=UPI003AA84BB4
MISFIVAMDINSLIGKENNLPWHLPADLKYFKNVTLGHPIVMGRKTYESIGKALPGRENFILTRDENYACVDCTIIHSISDIEALSKNLNKEIFVIGGAEIFKEAFYLADKLYITQISEKFEGDTFFPKFNKENWERTYTEKGVRDEKNPYEYTFNIYKKLS